MPIRNCPFRHCGGSFWRPILDLRLINPDTGATYRTSGLIDTGADNCSVPANFAPILGHILEAGIPIPIDTAGGEALAYSHTTEIQLFHPETTELLHTIPTTQIDYIPGLKTVLLGANNFLNDFILDIHYPDRNFSVKTP